jgi:hypothetical protein
LDQEISPHESCSRYHSNVKKNRWIKEEVKRYYRRILPPIVGRLNQRFNLTTVLWKDYHVMALFQQCSFAATVNSSQSAFCSLLTIDEMELLSYAQDLREYWRLGEGSRSLTSRLSCRLWTAILSKILELSESSLSSDYRPIGVFRFGHKPTVMLLLQLLGLETDTRHCLAEKNASWRSHLYANATWGQIKSRTFRMSRWIPFGANAIFEVYRCHSSTPYKQSEKSVETSNMNVRVLLNEELVRWPAGACSNSPSELCPLEKLLHYYRHSIDCSFHDLCGSNKI